MNIKTYDVQVIDSSGIPVGFITNMTPDAITMTSSEKELIFGTLLGDGQIVKRNNSYRLRIAHSIKQKAYVMWKYKKLERFCQTTQEPKEVTDRKGCSTIEFYTSSGTWLKDIYYLFYKPIINTQGITFVKTISQELVNFLPVSAILIAVWYLDDGSIRKDCYAGRIATQGFLQKESELLCLFLKKANIGCKTVLHSKVKQQYYISVPATNSSFKNLVAIIEHTVLEIPEMVYKLNQPRKPRND